MQHNFDTLEPEFVDIIFSALQERNGKAPYPFDVVSIRQSNYPSSDYKDFSFIYPEYGVNAPVYKIPTRTIPTEYNVLMPGYYNMKYCFKWRKLFAQQFENVVFKKHISDKGIENDFYLPKFIGANLIFHPIHNIFGTTSPVSNYSPGSIQMHPAAYPLFLEVYNNGTYNFTHHLIEL